MSITTRLATPDDAPTVHALTQAAFATLKGTVDPPSSAHLETVEAALTAGGGVLAEIAGRPVGAVRFRPEEDHLYVGRVAVAPDHRGHGVGRALMTVAERHAVALGLPGTRVKVRRMLAGNVAMFEHLGYQLVAEEPHALDPAASVLTLAKPVAPVSSGETIDG